MALVWAWGDNDKGQVGNGTTDKCWLPVPVKGVNGIGVLDNVASFATGSEHNLAVRVDGTVVAWGDNTHGQLATRCTSRTRRAAGRRRGGTSRWRARSRLACDVPGTGSSSA